MKVGAENRLQLTAASILAVLAVILVGRVIAGWVAPTEIASVGDRRSSATESNIGTKATRLDAFDPTLRSDWLGLSESSQYQGPGRNIFRLEASRLRTRPEPVPMRSAPVQLTNFSLPTVGLRFFGSARTPGESERIFLSNDVDVFIGKKGEIVDRRYRILQITATSVEIEDLISGVRQTLFLNQGW